MIESKRPLHTSKHKDLINAISDGLKIAFKDCGIELDDKTRNRLTYITQKHIVEQIGGQNFYIPQLKIESERRKAEIISKFNGANAKELAKEYGLTLARVYSICKDLPKTGHKAQRKKRQQEASQ